MEMALIATATGLGMYGYLQGGEGLGLLHGGELVMWVGRGVEDA